MGIFVEGLGPRTWRIHHLPSLASSLLVAGLWLGFLEGEVDLEPAIKNKQKYIQSQLPVITHIKSLPPSTPIKPNLHDRVLKAMTLAPEHKKCEDTHIMSLERRSLL